MSLLTLESVVVGYQQPVLGPISLHIGQGETLALCGSNGCGKSTLLKALNGEAQVFAGQIHYTPHTRIAVQKQHLPRLIGFPLSCAEYLKLLNADATPLPTRLQPLRKRRLDSLSGGQYQLLAVWACLASSANLILLDEPTNNLDPAGISLLEDLLATRRPEQAIMLISHEADFVARTCRRQMDLTTLHHADI